MNLTVVIDCDDQGNYSVGQEPHETPDQEAAEQQAGGEGAPGTGDDSEGGAGEAGMQMQPAKSLDDALKMARAMFMASAPDQGGAEQAFGQGYDSVASGGMPGQ